MTAVNTNERSAADTAVTERTGTIIAVCYSKELINNVAKVPHDSGEIAQWGIPGDRHYGETRITKGHVVPNKRTITVLGVEGTRSACDNLGIPHLPPGGLGENLLVEGLGDLSEVGSGDKIQVLSPDGEPKVILEVQKQNDPCANTQFYHKMMVKELYGRRGLLCTVLMPGHVQVGDKVTISRKS
ncbi:MAG TPA: MOSC domain-containing protein [Chloroflexia bacterium]|nr:MOSC domain-containing protein [Chloroflexia bacterium]